MGGVCRHPIGEILDRSTSAVFCQWANGPNNAKIPTKGFDVHNDLMSSGSSIL